MRLLLLAVPLLTHATALAQCPVPGTASSSLQRHSAAERLGYLTRALEADAAASRTWGLAWGAVYGVGTLGQLAAIPLLGPEDQEDFVVGAASTAVGVGFVILGMPEVVEDAPALAARVAGGGDDCALVAEAERLLVKDAANELSGVAWHVHALNIAFNLGVGLIIGAGFGHWLSALINFVVGAAIGEGTIFTQPTALDGAWRRYLSGDLGLGAEVTAVQLGLVPVAGGLGVAVRF